MGRLTRSLTAALASSLLCLVVGDATGLEVGGLTALPAVTPGASVLDNGGFEAVDGAVRGWKLAPEADVWQADGDARGGRGSIRMTGADRGRVIASASQTVTLEPGFYTLAGWVKTQGLGAAGPRSGARLCLDARPRLNWWMCTPTARGTTDWSELRQPSIPVEEAGTFRVTVGAYGRPDGTARFDDVSLTPLRQAALDAYLLYPNFRGLLFDDRLQTVRLAVKPADTRAGGRIVVSLLEEASGTVVKRREYEAAAVTAELDASGLPAGAYLVRAELSTGETYRYPDYRIVKAAARERERLAVWVDERNVTHLRGKPAFVLGLYTTSGYSTSRERYARGHNGWGTERMAQAPINMIINYWLGATPIPALTTYMDDLFSRGIYYLHTVNFYYEDHKQYGTIPYTAAKDGEDALNTWIARTLAKHKGLAGFYTADERPAEMVPAVFRQHRRLAAGAPGSVDYVVLGNGWQAQAPLWRDALDVLGLDPYPIKKAPGQNDLAMVGEWARLGQDAVMRSRPLWMVIQYFPLTREGGWPAYEDLKAMSWMAIVEGARGLFYWSFGARGLAWVKDPRQRAQRWDELVRVTREIKALEPVLLAPDAPLLAGESSAGAVRTLGKRGPDGARYLFAYNSKPAATSVTWTLADPAAEAVPLDGARTPLTIDSGRLAASFAPYEVKRYRIR